MGVMLVFVCPETGRDVPVCILRNGSTLEEVAQHQLTFSCLECGGSHVWSIDEGRLAFNHDEPPPVPQPVRIP